MNRSCIYLILTFTSLFNVCTDLFAQNDTAAKDSFFLLKYKGILGKVARSIVVDTSDVQLELQRNDRRFQRYRNRVIRKIIIQPVPFGTPINDTATKFSNTLIKLANTFHRQTRASVIRNNLFFRENERLSPYVMADNERFFRDLPYLGDARLLPKAVPGTRDSVDIIVLTKDVLSIGGSIAASSVNNIQANVREDNLFGWGDRLLFRGLYDNSRREKVGYGMEYIRRNILGTFIDGTIGFNDFSPSFNAGRREERAWYASFVRPLVNQYMRWTYAAEGGYRSTRNMYVPDSTYNRDFRYSYYNVDLWAGYNMRSSVKDKALEADRLRTLIGLRYIHQEFDKVPERYENEAFFRYTDITGVLGSLSIFRQDFYKTRYIYGFGRTEDVPEGLDVSINTGWTKKQNRERGYVGLNMELSYFSKQEHYFDYVLRVGGYTKDKHYEDVDLLLNLDFFTNLRKMGKWRQRTFISAGFSNQFNKVVNEPLFLQSEYGLPEYRNDSLFGGTMRATVKAESVFFSPWSFISFRFAPFVFARAAWIEGNTPPSIDRSLYSSVGAGIRTRNESLIFGTLELRAFYFPRQNFYGDSYRIEFNTNVQFKYSTQQTRRPEFVVIN